MEYFSHGLHLILIIKVEPYWNVNLALLLKFSSLMIKVEPYWNVNKSIPYQSKSVIYH